MGAFVVLLTSGGAGGQLSKAMKGERDAGSAIKQEVPSAILRILKVKGSQVDSDVKG